MWIRYCLRLCCQSIAQSSEISINERLSEMSEVAEQFKTLLLPISSFYADADRPLPEFTKISGDAMPEPYRQLLVHENDMTPTLEAYWGMKIHLRLIAKEVEDQVMHRQVVLEANSKNIPVEYGAIRIYLERFGDEPRQMILESYRPLGTILSDFEIVHDSHPSAYFKVVADDHIAQSLGVDVGVDLYGRCNVLVDPEGHHLAEVIEVLPTMSAE